jgi:hypothetical protein
VAAQPDPIREWREQYARHHLRVDFEPLLGSTFRASVMSIFPELRIVRATLSPVFSFATRICSEMATGFSVSFPLSRSFRSCLARRLPQRIFAKRSRCATCPRSKPPESVLKRGEYDKAITQYRVNKKTGLTSFCSHGGCCYPTHLVENGAKVEALRLTNCKKRQA